LILFDGALGLLGLGLWLFCIIDVITTPEGQTRNLPKVVWLLLVILLFDVGSIAWLVAGRPWTAKAGARAGWDTPARGTRRPTNPDDDEEFLAGLKARAEEQRRRARETEDPPA
jgi:hypothetical protein